ncbi:MAG: DUF3052 family protein [Acidobacteriaceae bacterium]|nr:DUF3052 family protein [Acidobacteriaceae bacterium]MBV8572041.1 DUF3052 family protein [Acidobacteriaceae bacterium]
MGQECECRLRYAGQTVTGKARLETDFILFRGERRLKVPFKDLTAVSAAHGCLKLEFAGGPATLELGPAAEKWARNILHPPSLLDKLGVKPGVDIAVVGDFEPGFTRELGTSVQGCADVIFLAARTAADLQKLPAAISRLKPRGCIWIVYPKGAEAIREMEVIQAGRSAGLKDTKVVSFSSSHTGLRFSRPAKPGSPVE